MSEARAATPDPATDRLRAFVILAVTLVVCFWIWLFGLRSRAPELEGPSTGVAACDEYLAIMSRCLRNIPPDGKAALAETVRTTRANLTRAGARPSEAAALTRVCSEMRDAVAKNPTCR